MTDGADGADDVTETDGADDAGVAERTSDDRSDGPETHSDPKEGEPEDAGDDAGSEAPLADLARRVSDRRRERETESGAASSASLGVEEVSESGDASGGTDDPFREISVAEIDEEALWSSLEADEEPTVAVGSSDSPGAAALADEGAATAGSDEHVVAKGDYCQKCPYLHDPPELACTHEGTEIVAVEDSEHFRVRNCPVVDESDASPR